MKAKAIMFLGTGSDVGKSVLAAALCRVLKNDGYRVAPFKAQNMALNSFVTPEGGEMGRAQVVQAEACGIKPHVDMNPILLKPTTTVGSQVIVLGKPIGNMTAKEYYEKKKDLLPIVQEAYERLAGKYDVIVVEGAGSAVELNLKEHDIVNLSIAKLFNVPSLLVGDIDRGGIFASVIGSILLMEPEERELIKGIIINKFRGDPGLFRTGVEIIESRSGKPVIGVVPYFSHIVIPEEDSVALRKKLKGIGFEEGEDLLKIGIVRLPYISNYTDFDALENEKNVEVYYFDSPEDVFSFDAIIIPGSKNTISDLKVLHEKGIVDALRAFWKAGRMVVGICGGYQMLGVAVRDPLGVESNIKEAEGISLIPMVTEMFKDKMTYQVKAMINVEHPFWKDLEDKDSPVVGYEIHNGKTFPLKELPYLFRIVERRSINEEGFDGLMSESGFAWGTYIHGIFDNDFIRKWFLKTVASMRNKNISFSEGNFNFLSWKERQYDLLAEHFRKYVDVERLYKIIGL